MDKKSDLKGKKRVMTNNTLTGTDWQIYNIRLFGSQMGEVLTIVEGWISSRLKNKWIATVNPEFVIKATKDEKFLDLLKETDLNVMDGIGLIWAKELDRRSSIVDRRNFIKKLMVGAKVGVEILKGQHKNELVSGADLMPELCKLAAKKEYKVFFLGGFGNRAERTAQYFRSQMSDFKSQFCAGEPDLSNKEVLEQINKFKPDILFVAYGMKNRKNGFLKIEIKLILE
jgi:N-acetylglucosaminyldiphosphoundecaprenol N-acetyl-beta-D-mannosaminyltransferase